ncbi:MAG TPA: DUF4157 domain-containing protein [Thermoanaerobaculia bacterium]|nr:DUF4157 domain-containing protein [Thermoanaerobaculia bacterium]
MIQGSFPHGLPRFGATPLHAAPAQAAHVQQALAHGRAAHVTQPAMRPGMPLPAARPHPNAVALPPHLAPVLGASGQPLPDDVRQPMEAVFGTSFADVRIHVDPRVSTLGAHAFTHGANIHIAPGQFAPGTVQGRHLIAHELAHVVQQRAGRVNNPFGSGVAIVHDPALEADAERMATRAALHRPAPQPPAPALPQHASLQAKWNNPGHNKWAGTKSSARRGGVRKAKWLREYEAQVEAVKKFMNDVVGPWATQARIAQLIDENMDDLQNDQSVTHELKTLEPHRLRNPNSVNPQIAPGKSPLLAPSRSPGRLPNTTSVIHRGDVEIEVVDEAAYVRVYTALWAEARANDQGEITHKDVHQDPNNKQITIYTGRDQGEDRNEHDNEKMPIMWVSGGQPLRQLKWFYKYPVEKYNPGARPVIRSFLIPLKVWNEISAAAVNEESAGKPENKDKPFNVDTAYGANQFGVRGPSLDKLRNSALPGSLVSYVGDPSHSLNKHGGQVVGIKRLHKKLGAPVPQKGLPIWVDPNVGKFVRTKNQRTLANDLMFYYAVWTHNDHFLPDDKKMIPKQRRHEMLRAFLIEQGVPLPENYWLG